MPLIVETPHVRESWRRGWKADNFTIDRMAGRFVDRYIAVSYANARYLIEEKGLPERKVRVIQNGTDLSRFNPNACAPAGMREELGFAPGDPVMLVAARLEPQKGHKVLAGCDAGSAARVSECTRGVPWGRSTAPGTGAAVSTTWACSPNVRFIGFRSNVTDWLALCDFTVLPSFYEGLPLVAVESLAAGRPMVATAVDGTPEVVLNGTTGITVPSGDPAALATAICTMLRSPALQQRMAEQGRAHVLERFSQERQVRETGEFYLEALGRPTVPAEQRRRTAGGDDLSDVAKANGRTGPHRVPVRIARGGSEVLHRRHDAALVFPEPWPGPQGSHTYGSLARNEATWRLK